MQPTSTSEKIEATLGTILRFQRLPRIYPSYIGFRIKDAIKALIANGDPKVDGPIVTAVGEMETIGDCRYALPITDFEGNTYRVTIECVKRPDQAFV